ncbi:Plasmodium exported protein, unknown function [Plasmodium malariae]|uniref:Pv-fam-d protein n=1 Tax=Plasmodium malariae TaxID=5858 RepID=A0A1A8X2V9_PLAMA|nr:Plasmodium exported protein, unknown function [Plasmodium malariae]SBS98939.1 Plasmodium exported protein, unknown function [Plasmodium malariae]SBT86769.1 Plasmodium exported protein, unknown function [Plasmodium malariae]
MDGGRNKIFFIKTLAAFTYLIWPCIYKYEFTTFCKSIDNKISKNKSLNGRASRLLFEKIKAHDEQVYTILKDKILDINRDANNFKGQLKKIKTDNNILHKPYKKYTHDNNYKERRRERNFDINLLQEPYKKYTHDNIFDEHIRERNTDNDILNDSYNKYTHNDSFQKSYNSINAFDIFKQIYDKVRYSHNFKKLCKRLNIYDKIKKTWNIYKFLLNSEEPNIEPQFHRKDKKLDNSSKIDDHNDIDKDETAGTLKNYNDVDERFLKLNKQMIIAIKFFNSYIKPVLKFILKYIKKYDRMYEKAVIKVFTKYHITRSDNEGIILKKIKSHLMVVYPIISYSLYTIVLHLLDYDSFTVGSTGAMLAGITVYVLYKNIKYYNICKNYGTYEEVITSLGYPLTTKKKKRHFWNFFI